MNPSTALARTMVDELWRQGVRDVVLCPGSRSAPLAFALQAADAAGAVRLHVRIDERSAGFLALGLARASGRPTAVACTSGTAVANLHPAVLEASHAGVPLVLLTADRPPELRDVGANQTIDQLGLFGVAVRWFHETGSPAGHPAEGAYWRSTVARAVIAASGTTTGDPGPVHLNLALRDPLVPDADDAGPAEGLPGRAGLAPWTVAEPEQTHPSALRHPVADWSERTVLVAGDGAGPEARRLAEACGWPLLAEPTSGARGGPNAVGTHHLLLSDPTWTAAHRPQVAVVMGRPTLTRTVSRLLADPGVEVVVVSPHGRWPDAGHVAGRVLTGLAPEPDHQPRGWLDGWAAAERAARAAVDGVLDGAPEGAPTEPLVARDVVAGLPAGSLLVLGSSMPVRDVNIAAAPRDGLTVVANRGVAGIDGTVSTAVGAALGHAGPAVALMGDLTFLHDSNGLVIGPDEPRPALTVVVVNNDGGGIFGLLEQGAARFAPAFERVFGTPHGVDIGALCAATGTPHEVVAGRDRLRDVLAGVATAGPGVRVVEVRTDRASAAAVHARLREAVSAALVAV